MSSRQAHAMLRRAAAQIGAKAVNKKTVTFTCDNPACVVRITIGPNTFIFQSTGGTLLAPGEHDAFYAVKPAGQTFTITASGASMTPIVNSTSGIRVLEV